jgi:tetraacyldisaccharide 4'-kinase
MIGANVAVVSRGYGRRSREKVQIVSNGHQVLEQFPKASDEALVCAQELENIPVICSPKRINGIAAASLMFGAKTVILDDAFSHLSAWRDVNILLIDASDPFGGGRLLPAGYLREPLSSANRADAIIITRANLVSSQELERVKKDVSAIAKKTIPFFLCDISPTALVSPDMAQAALKTIEGRKVALLSAIGSPAQFEKTVGSLGATVVSHRSFRDHHPFSTEEIQNIVDIADKDTMLLTTQKDFVRIPPAYRRFFHQLKIEARIREANEFANFLRT